MPEDIQTEPTRYELPLTPLGGKDSEHPQSSGPTSVSEAALAANTLWFCRLRWLIIAILAGFGALTLLEAPSTALGMKTNAIWAFVCAGILVVCNVAYMIHIRLIGDSPEPRVIHINLWTQIVVDLLVLTGVIHFAGSLETHIANAYLFHIVLSCIFFSTRQSSIVTMLACMLFLICVLSELAGILPNSHLHLDTSIRNTIQASRSEILMVIGSVWGIMLAVWYLASHLSRMLRRNQHDLAETNIRLIAAREGRTKHMLHTAHELKTPCSAIYANARVLIDGYCGDLPDQAVGVLNRIAHRCLGLSSQVQDMLKLANLRSVVAPPADTEIINAAKPLQSCIEQVSAAAGHRDVTIQTDIQPAMTRCVADHLEMFFLNLVSNAVNYSHEGGTVRVTCKTGPDKRPQVTIGDEGIGIPPEKLPHIFEEYYRTTDAVQHNRGSSGLGLAIVQQIALEHGIALSVESKLGKGTVFTAILPPNGHAPTPPLSPEDPS
jgi:signal transduction histidine kinase